MTVQPEPQEGMSLGLVRLYRSNHGWVDRKLPFDVYVDGSQQATILPREFTDLRLPEGTHRIEVSCIDEGIASIEVAVVPERTKYLICSSRPGAAWFNPLLLGRWARVRIRESHKPV